MHTPHIHRLINIGLRGATLASKFLLIFLLARLLEPKELALYGLLAATIGYALYLLGFDFYAFTTREIVKSDKSTWGGLLKSQGALSAILYLVFMPLLGIVFALDLLPWYLAGWFFALLVLEHMAQELGRLMVAISEPLLASWIMFLRGGLWAIAVSAWMYHQPEARSLHTVLAAWTAGGISCVLLGLYKITTLRMGGWQQAIDWKWIKRGLKIAIPLFVATLALRGIFTLDRYWFEDLAGLEILAAYVLFMGICNALTSFLDAGVFVFLYPKLIAAYNQKQAQNFRASMQSLGLQTLALTIVFSLIAYTLLPYLLLWIDKPAYSDSIHLFKWLLGATALYILGMIPHFGLYAQGHDRPIINSHLTGFASFCLATWHTSLTNAELAVPIGVCVGFACILLIKTWALIRLTPPHYLLATPNA